MKENILVIGKNINLFGNIVKCNPLINIYVIEEPVILNKMKK